MSSSAPPVPSAVIEPSACGAMLARGEKPELIDVRTPAEFASVHADGAKLVPLNQLDVASVLAARGSPDALIYLLCKSGARAAKARDKFVAAGFTGAVVVEGGTDAWIRAGLPVVRGRARVSLERQVRMTAGLLVLIGVVLGIAVDPWFLALAGFVGAGLAVSGITDWCGMEMLLAKMPWNRPDAS